MNLQMTFSRLVFIDFEPGLSFSCEVLEKKYVACHIFKYCKPCALRNTRHSVFIYILAFLFHGPLCLGLIFFFFFSL